MNPSRSVYDYDGMILSYGSFVDGTLRNDNVEIDAVRNVVAKKLVDCMRVGDDLNLEFCCCSV